MFVQFRNGVVQYQYSPTPSQPTFLTRTTTGSGYNININTDEKDLIVTVSQGSAEYLLRWNRNVTAAWSFDDALTHYLYVDIDRRTGVVTFGSTTLPITYSNTYPAIPQLRQNFFYTGDSNTYEWSGSLWVPKTRVFVGQCSNATLVPYTGTQTDTHTPYKSGTIVYSDDGKPIIKNNKTFLTTEDNLLFNSVPGNNTTLENATLFATAQTSLGAPRFVKLINDGYIDYAQPSDVGNAIIFLLTEPLNAGETTSVVVSGKIISTTWNWASTNMSIWCGINGALVTADPSITNPSIDPKNPIAKTLDSITILMNPMLNSFSVGGSGSGSGSSLTWVDVVGVLGGATQNAVAFDGILADTTNGIVTINLPVGANAGDTIVVAQKVPLTTNSIFIDPGTDNIMGINDVFEIDAPYVSVELVRRADPYGWVVIPRAV